MKRNGGEMAQRKLGGGGENRSGINENKWQWQLNNIGSMAAAAAKTARMAMKEEKPAAMRGVAAAKISAYRRREGVACGNQWRRKYQRRNHGSENRKKAQYGENGGEKRK